MENKKSLKALAELIEAAKERGISLDTPIELLIDVEGCVVSVTTFQVVESSINGEPCIGLTTEPIM
jgi:hypothetical protein